MDVGIVGCGTAGPAAALFLARAGHRVTVYERVADPGPVGAGIVLQPTGQTVLARLGLHDAVVDRGARLTGLRCVTHRQRLVLELSYDMVGPELFGVGLHRGVLFEQLLAAVRREPVTLRLGVGAEDLAPGPGGRQWIVDAAGARHGPHELIIVADGARSQLRDDTDVGKRIAAYPWGALWFVAEDPEQRFRDVLHQVVRRADRMLGFLPTGFGPGNAQTPLVSLYWSVRASDVAAWRAAPLASWKAEVLAYVPSAGPVLDQIHDEAQLLFAAYHDVTMWPWHTERVVYLGDAGHAMSPQLGQGCNLALLDAMVLAECLDGVGDAGKDGARLAAALDEYSRRRKWHLAVYQFATRWLTPFFQSDYAPLGWLRDVFMPLLGRLPWARRLMVQSMTGGLAGGAAYLPPRGSHTRLRGHEGP